MQRVSTLKTQAGLQSWASHLVYLLMTYGVSYLLNVFAPTIFNLFIPLKINSLSNSASQTLEWQADLCFNNHTKLVVYTVFSHPSYPSCSFSGSTHSTSRIINATIVTSINVLRHYIQEHFSGKLKRSQKLLKSRQITTPSTSWMQNFIDDFHVISKESIN